MGRVKIKFPDENPLFITAIPVRITDINYGGHLGNDRLLSVVHEARVQALSVAGLTELEAGGHGLIMADVMIAYRGEAFYGDELRISLWADEVTARTFDLLYQISVQKAGSEKEIAHAKTGMVCFDYNTRKVTAMSTALKSFLTRMEF